MTYDTQEESLHIAVQQQITCLLNTTILRQSQNTHTHTQKKKIIANFYLQAFKIIKSVSTFYTISLSLCRSQNQAIQNKRKNQGEKRTLTYT